jgi:hypothetical protein
MPHPGQQPSARCTVLMFSIMILILILISAFVLQDIRGNPIYEDVYTAAASGGARFTAAPGRSF